jgi:hypothetical protein
MKRHTKLFGVTLLCVGWTGLAFAGNQFFNFDQDPISDPALSSAIIIGTHNAPNGGPGGVNHQVWSSGAGVATNGFPKTGGYLSISDATNGNNNLVFVFPDVDNGLPIQGFQIDMDMRVGNGTLGRPADGFSISFARSGDVALVDATNLTVGGFAGGDGSYAAASNPNGSTDLENGTKTGVAVVFDAWQGNWLPDTTGISGPGSSTDREGIAVRVDDHTLVQLNLQANRNERDCTNIINGNLPSGVTNPAAGFVGSAAQTNLLNPMTNGSGAYQVGGLSMQTGTNAFFASNAGTCGATYGNTDTSGSFTNLYWEHLLVRLTNISSTAIPTNNLTVIWKGVQVINTNLLAFSPTVGRLVLAGRTGGNMQHCHVDNLHVVTSPTTNTYIVKVIPTFNGFSFEISDNGSLTVTNVSKVQFDAADVSASSLPTVSYSAPLTSGGFTNNPASVFFPPLTAHTVTLTWVDNTGFTNVGAIQFTVPVYSQLPAQFALPAGAIDTTTHGLLLTAYQTTWNNPNVIGWTDELFEGLHGTNLVSQSSPGNPVVNGYQVWANPLGFFNIGGKAGNVGTPGMYNTASSLGTVGTPPYTATGDADFTAVGLGIGTYPQDYRHDYYDNIALEFFGYIYFPTSGVYNFSFGNDDQYQITTSWSPYDRMGTIIAASPGVRVPNLQVAGAAPAIGSDIQNWYVTQPGYYPIRAVWENGGGGCIFEWYSYQQNPGGSPNPPGYGTFLVNDWASASNPSATNGVLLLGYYGLSGTVDTGPYLSSAMPPRNPTAPSGFLQTYGDTYYYSPIVVDLNDGTTAHGNGKTIVDSSIALSVDGISIGITHTRPGASSTVHVLQNGPVNWSTFPGSNTNSVHTNLLSFVDVNGSNYVYTWQWILIGGVSGVSALDGTNLVNTASNSIVLTVPSSLAQPVGAIDYTQPGARVKVWQTPMEAGQSHSGWADAELMGQHGFNVANTSGYVGTGYYVWSNLFDFRYDSGGGSGAEWNFDLEDSNPNVPSLFGTGANDGVSPVISPAFPVSQQYAPTYRFVHSGVNTKCEESVWEFSGWLVFSNAGPYIMNFNSDDGVRLMFPQGNPMGKLNPATVPYITNIVLEANVGRGVAGQSGTIYNGNTWAFVVVPQAGAYPFRLIWYNGGTGAGFEWSVVQPLPDGRVSRVPVNDPMTPGSLKVYQTLTSGNTTAPYIAKIDPVYDEPDVYAWEPSVIDIADGPSGKNINLANANIQLWSDGMPQTVNATQPGGGITHVVQQLAPGFLWINGNHTNILSYKDNSGNVYSNVWWWVARAPTPAIVWVPTSMRMDPAQVDHSQPGLRVKSYQTVNGANSDLNQVEQQYLGILGANLITVNPPGYVVWTNPVDFCDNIGLNGGHGEYRYNYSFSNYFGDVLQGGGGAENNNTHIFAGWFEFTRPGLYAMTVNSDDGFKITMPYGYDPFNEQGLNLGFVNAGRGDTGGSANPYNGSSTPSFFNIPQAGAYPIRLLWFNGGGGLAVEWTLIQPLSDGSVERILVGENVSAPDCVKVYQTLLTNPPAVIATVQGGNVSQQTNAPALTLGTQPQAVLGNTLGFSAQTSSQYPPNQDFWIQLRDGSSPINTGTIALSLAGVTQPITVTNGGGLTTVFRFGTNGLWPSGIYAPLMLSFQDMAGNSYSYPIEWVITPFWGTLHHGYDSTWGDPNSPGFKIKTYQVDPAVSSSGKTNFVTAATTGNFVPPNRNYIYEQVLAGLWGPNWAFLGPTNYPAGGPSYAGFTDFGFFDAKGVGPTNGVVNFNAQYPAQAGNFQYSATYQYFNNPMPGMRGYGPSTGESDLRSDAVTMEILSYILFPTNGIYTLGVSSDDGFRVWQQWDRPANIGALVVNSPPAVAGRLPAAINVFEPSQGNISTPVTNLITGNLVLATGAYGASTNGEGMVLANASAISGNIALLYRGVNGVGSVNQQVNNAYAAGARAVVLINKHRPFTDGATFAEEFTVSAQVPIPMVCIEESDGTNLVAALGSGNVNVTITPDSYAQNPPDDRVLGCTSVGKGNSDCNFSVVVTNAPGLYPIRLTYQNGNGGVNVDFYSLTGNPATNSGRVLINDVNTASGIALQAFYSLIPPHVTPNPNGSVTVTWVGTLLTSTDPTLPIGSWTTVAQTSPYTFTPTPSQSHQYYRAVYAQRP